jgi:hypothetical protein
MRFNSTTPLNPLNYIIDKTGGASNFTREEREIRVAKAESKIAESAGFLFDGCMPEGASNDDGLSLDDLNRCISTHIKLPKVSE